MIRPHIMIDLETMGGTPNGVIAQIGFAIFNPETGEVVRSHDINVDMDSCLEAGLAYHGDTICWWLTQGEEARKALFDPAPVSLRAALEILSNTYGMYQPEATWAYPASFDLSILEAAHRGLKVSVPWHYRTLRDARTLIAQALHRDELTRGGVQHVGSADCLNQIRWLIEAKNRLQIELL